MTDEIKKALEELFYKSFNERAQHVSKLPHSGSDRQYYRLTGNNHTAIGAHNPDEKENKTFLYMTRFFLQEQISVPQIYQRDLKKNIYLLEDLGDQTLFSIISNQEWKDKNQSRLVDYLKKAVKELARIQIVAGKKMNFNQCYPYKEFNRSSIIYDLEYFRTQFLNRLNIEYNNEMMQKDFKTLTQFIDKANKDYFMYRDFQSRNIMVHHGEFYFIDYQGGRKGPLQYDLASLLFQARAKIPKNIREEILEYYIKIARMLTPLRREEFIIYYYAIALIRVLQTLGAYGLKGLKEKKEHFIQSIPFALNNLNTLTEKNKILGELPELTRVIEILKQTKTLDNGLYQ